MKSHLSFRQLFKLLRRQRKLAERRDPIFEANRAAKWLIGVSMASVIIYLIMLAIILALAANDSRRFTSLEFIMSVSPFILLADFWIRFIAQQTPSQIIKPYVLMPIPKYMCIDSFIITSLFNWGNTIWFTLLVPYCIMSVVFSYGLFSALSVLLLFYIIILADSQAYAIVRTLNIHHFLWWLLPIGMSVAILSPLLFKDFDFFLKTYAMIGTGIESGNLLPHLLAFIALIILVFINRKIQYASVMQELGREKDSKPIKVYSFTTLNKLGELGEYLKLEIKSLSRNKNPRKNFITATAVVIIISAVIAFTDIYDNPFMTNFWCIYNFVIYAATILVKIMAGEGNYIDFLMVHKENILKLLTAKYYFFCLLLIFPFILMLPMVFVDKWDILMLISYGIFTAGFQHFLLMQLAVYNNKTMPLNEKITSKGGVDNNYIQILAAIAAFTLPLMIISMLEAFYEDKFAWTVMMGIGLLFIVTHKLWLRNIYNRLMKRRYKNISAFHA
ncbi:MAG: DUF5687 family protein [Prevotella sp.]|jgi:hypothetical protein